MAEHEPPIMCTLSPVGMVDRLTEFGALFAEGLTGLEREPLQLRLVFDASTGREARIRDLFARERDCCAFLTFTFAQTQDGLVVEMTAPANAGPTLDGMQALAERSALPQALARGWTG